MGICGNRMVIQGCMQECLEKPAPAIQGCARVGGLMASMIDSDADVPVYQQLAAILRRKIDSGEISPRRAIPSKRTLTEEYSVSPGTVERAVQALRARGT